MCVSCGSVDTSCGVIGRWTRSGSVLRYAAPSLQTTRRVASKAAIPRSPTAGISSANRSRWSLVTNGTNGICTAHPAHDSAGFLTIPGVCLHPVLRQLLRPAWAEGSEMRVAKRFWNTVLQHPCRPGRKFFCLLGNPADRHRPSRWVGPPPATGRHGAGRPAFIGGGGRKPRPRASTASGAGQCEC